MPGFATTITFADGDQVTSSKLNEIVGGLAPTSDLLADGTLAIVLGQIKLGTVLIGNMGANSVGTTQLVDGSVTNAKLGPTSVGTANIQPLSVSGPRIMSGAVDFSKINANALPAKGQMQNETSQLLVTPDMVRYSPGVAKAYGGFNITGTGRTLRTGSYNITSLTRVDSTHTTVVIDTDMSTTLYVAVAQFESDGTENLSATIYDKQTGTFRIMHPAEGPGRAISFVVYGIQS